MRRTQIYLTDRESEALDRVARTSGSTRSELIRMAVEAQYLASADQHALERALLVSAGAWGRAGIGRGDGSGYVEQLRRGRTAEPDASVRRIAR
ncbi:hypothetical protein BH20CHL6_BH20CHL6_06500 [soil metagenome]